MCAAVFGLCWGSGHWNPSLYASMITASSTEASPQPLVNTLTNDMDREVGGSSFSILLVAEGLRAECLLYLMLSCLQPEKVRKRALEKNTLKVGL